MGMPPYVPSNRPISTAMFWSNPFNFDPLLASECISQSANIAGGLNAAGSPLLRGTVLYGPAANAPITTTTLLTTATGAGNARCILAADIDTSGGQVTGLVYTQGKFLDTAMTFTAAGAASDAASLWDYGIYVLTVEGRSGQLIPMMKLPTTGGPIPNSLNAKDSAEALKEEVASIKAAMARSGTLSYPPPQTEPAWAIAAFGETKPTPEQQAEEKTAEAADELTQKQAEAMQKLETEQAKAMSDLLKKQSDERSAFVKAHPPAPAPTTPAAPTHEQPANDKSATNDKSETKPSHWPGKR